MVDRERPDAPERNFDRLMERVERLETATYGRNASVHRGSTEFVGEDSLIVRGSQLVVGTIRTIGRQIIEGLGILDVFGLINLFGSMKVTTGGGITVEDGGDVVVNGGEIRVGNIVLRDGKIYVGEGASQIVIDGATGEIIAGGMRINPGTNGGQIDFGGGRSVNAGTGFLGLYDGDRFVVFNGSGVTMVAGGRSLSVGPSGIRASGLSTVSETDSGGAVPGTLWAGTDGLVYRVVPD